MSTGYTAAKSRACVVQAGTAAPAGRAAVVTRAGFRQEAPLSSRGAPPAHGVPAAPHRRRSLEREMARRTHARDKTAFTPPLNTEVIHMSIKLTGNGDTRHLD